MAGAVRWIGDGEVEKGNNGRKVWWLEAWPKVWWLREVGWSQVVWSEGVVAGSLERKRAAAGGRLAEGWWLREVGWLLREMKEECEEEKMGS